MQFEDETAIVVTRYDRALDAGRIIRIHQEDMAQAAGAHPTGKYQNEGGPGIQEIVDLIIGTRTSGSGVSVVRFFAATAPPYPDVNIPRKVKLTMAIGKHYRDFEIEARHVLADAAVLGIDPQWAYDQAQATIGGVAEAYSQATGAARLTGDEEKFAALIVDKVAARAKVIEAELQKTPTPEGSATQDHRAAQARNMAGKFR